MRVSPCLMTGQSQASLTPTGECMSAVLYCTDQKLHEDCLSGGTAVPVLVSLLCLCRFTVEEKAKRDPFCFMPFGMGPRNCIGMRFALLEAKMALIQILRHFRMVRSSSTEVNCNV